jgi:carbohydrate-selective porin OprB
MHPHFYKINLSLLFVCLTSFFTKAQEADTTAKDFISEGFKVHTYVMNMTDFAKVTSIRKPLFLGVNGIQITTFTKENKWWKNGMFSTYILNTYGDNPTTDYVGDYQMFDNIESFPDTNNHIHLGKGQLNYRTFIYSLYYQHFFKKSRLLLGQYDLNFDFAFSNIGLNFINSSFGLQPTLAYNVPSFSTFPFTNLTARYEYDINENVSFRAAIAQGVGGNQLTNPHATKYVETFKDGGLFMISEISRSSFNNDLLLSEYKFGVWGHTGSKSMHFKNYTNKTDTTTNHFNFGAYFIADKLLKAEANDSSQGLYAFIDLGWAPGDYNIFNYYAGGGLSYTGLFPKRNADVISLALATPFYSKGIVKVDNYSLTEKALELNYNFVSTYFNFQPCIQYLSNIGGTHGLEKFAFMLRIASHKGVFY